MVKASLEELEFFIMRLREKLQLTLKTSQIDGLSNGDSTSNDSSFREENSDILRDLQI